jgi:hypothetical protein
VSTFQRYRKNVYSQNGEDGVIAEIVRRIGLQPSWTCDVGAWDGRYGSNCYALVKRGWPCLMIEANPSKYQYLQQLARRLDGRIKPFLAHVEHTGGPDSLDAIVERAELSGPIELISIDIDSYDYHVWRSFERRPAIVVIEIGSNMLPGERHIYSGGPRLTSFTSMLELARSKLYTLACHTGNMIFVRNEEVSKLGLSAHELEHPESMFVRDWVNPTRAQVWKRKIRFLTPQRAWVKCVNALHGNGPG